MDVMRTESSNHSKRAVADVESVFRYGPALTLIDETPLDPVTATFLIELYGSKAASVSGSRKDAAKRYGFPPSLSLDPCSIVRRRKLLLVKSNCSCARSAVKSRASRSFTKGFKFGSVSLCCCWT